MRVRTSAMVLCVLWLQTLGNAQSTSDPVSGNWGDNGVPFLELKFDGKRTVTGDVWWRGDGQAIKTPIKTGTYDAGSRKLRLEGEATRPDGVTATYVIEGTVDGNTVSGTFKFGDRGGEFKFTKLTADAKSPERDE